MYRFRISQLQCVKQFTDYVLLIIRCAIDIVSRTTRANMTDQLRQILFSPETLTALGEIAVFATESFISGLELNAFHPSAGSSIVKREILDLLFEPSIDIRKSK